MTDKSPLFWQVYERLANDENLEPRSKLAVEASFEGSDGVEAAIAGSFAAFEGDVRSEAIQDDAQHAYLSSIAVEGFRGIGPTATLELKEGPGLTLVVGRNGSGKSSFAEGLEVLLTGDSLRWSKRKPRDEWTAGWRNLHKPQNTRLTAKFSVEGRKLPVTIKRYWKDDDDNPDIAQVAVDYGDRKEDGLQGLGWTDALTTYRPILSYNELGNALDAGPAHLFDLLRDVLGMDKMTDAIDALGAVQKRLNKEGKGSKDALPALLAKLKNTDDERAEAALVLIEGKRKIDIEALTDIAADDEDDGGGQRELLRRVSSLKIPNGDDVRTTAKALRDTHKANATAQASSAGHQLKTEGLLKQAMAWYEGDESESKCPVCGEGQLDDAWLEATRANLAKAQEGARQAKMAKQALQGAVDTAKRLIRATTEPSPCTLSHFELARTQYDVWTAGSSDQPLELANHLETSFDALEDAFSKLKVEALAALETARADWRPVRRALETWLDTYLASETAKADLKVVKAALAWLRETDALMRTERFAPIKSRATEIWNELRHHSNVAMTDIRLEGKGNRRRATIDVTVDETESVALGVMSQGELHSMLLSLFLPRLTLPESPFGFLIIDDPVQAMDPAKVEGLARVLHEVAAKRQVIVFTHDERLPEAIRRLQIPATIQQVERMPKSVVTLSEAKSPSRQYLLDAYAVANDSDYIGPQLTGRVVPGLCRAALETKFKEIAQNRLLGEGELHEVVAEKIRAAHGINNLATLALFGDTKHGAELLNRLNNSFGRSHTDTYVCVRDHVHKPYAGNAKDLIGDTQGLLNQLDSV